MAPPAVFLPHLFVQMPVVVTLDQRGHSNRTLRFPPPAHSRLLQLQTGAVTTPLCSRLATTEIYLNLSPEEGIREFRS
jgi:hypothetical protein